MVVLIMKEITIEYFEEHFDEIMNQLENENCGFLVRTPNGDGIILTPFKNKVIETMERKGLIEELK